MYFKTIDFKKYSSIRIGQKVEVLMVQKNDTIVKDRYLIGGANNILISSNPPKLMMLSKEFDFIKEENGFLYIGGATPTGKILSYSKKENIANFEFCAKLPGTLGGLLAMNAGVKEYEIFNILDSIKIENSWIKKENIEYGYRFAKLKGIALEARFNIKKGFNPKLVEELNSLRANQPKGFSAGSAFKNPKGDYAGRLIEAVGLKGEKKGDMQISTKHSNFLINNSNGTFEDAKYLLDLAKEKVLKEFNILLEEEIKII